MAAKRTYDDGCAVAQALDVVGERWALLVVRDLLLGPKRFTDLLHGLEGVSTDVLTQRLRDLSDAGVVQRRRLGPPVGAWVYELTPWGAALEDTVLGLARWAHESPRMRYDLPLGTDSQMLAIKESFDSGAAGGLDATIALHIDDESFWLQIANGELTMARGEIPHADARIRTDREALGTVLQSKGSIRDAQESDHLQLTGDHDVVEKFVACLSLS